ncbi:MAG: EAL domain-containing protein, partial [Pseudomonadota bacterium]
MSPPRTPSPSPRPDERPPAAWVGDIVSDGSIRTLFQPIADSRSGIVMGYESLSRGPKSHPLEGAEPLFTAAREADLSAELDVICVTTAVTSFAALRARGRIFINLTPAGLLELARAPGQLARILERAGISPGRVVFEITEQA